ncbi:MAG: HAD family phosphatase [Bacteroidales bacterium]|nr:HAD family phosphatase [Bacteroidales bacterium]
MSFKNKFKNIIFDLGGVLIDLNESKTIDCFGGANISSFYTKKLNPAYVSLAQSFETGEISADQFRNGVSNLFNLKISKAKFDICWNAMVGNMPTHRIEMLLKVRENFKIYALSNTNIIHYQHFTKFDSWEPKLFNGVYLSHQLKMRKPDKAIFEFVLNENNLKPEETFFVDDIYENIEAANKLGIFGHHVKGEILNLFKELLDINIKI